MIDDLVCSSVYLVVALFSLKGVQLCSCVLFFYLLHQVVVYTTAGTSCGIYRCRLYVFTMAPVDRADGLYDAFSTWLCRVDAHTTRTPEWTTPVLDSFLTGDARSFHDIAGMSQSTLTVLPDAPSHAKAAFAWRAVIAATRTLDPRVNQPGHVPVDMFLTRAVRQVLLRNPSL